MKHLRLALLLTTLLAGAAGAPSAAEAQGRGNGPDRPRSEGVDRRDRDGDRDRDRDDRGIFGREERRNDQGRRPGEGPPFCRNGQGHPVHGREWCRDRGWDEGGALDDIFGLGREDVGRFDPRDERDHEAFHRDLDRRYAELAARRPLDAAYQLDLRRRRDREHDRWHAR